MSTQQHFNRLRAAGLPLTEIWRHVSLEKLNGRTIVDVQYLTDEECDDLGWSERAAVLVLDDGNSLFAAGDDEGNNAGALFTTFEDLPILPVIRR